MPAVSVSRERIADGSLPSVCIVCGREAPERALPAWTLRITVIHRPPSAAAMGENLEVGPKPVIEQIAAQTIEHLRRGVNGHAFRGTGVGLIEKHRQRCQVIEMRVGQKQVLDLGLSLGRQEKTQAAGIDRHGIVEQIRSQELPASQASVSAWCAA